MQEASSASSTFFLIEIQDHEAGTLAPRRVDPLAAPHRHTHRRVLWRWGARAGVDRAHHNRRAHGARERNMHSVGGARACERDSGAVPMPACDTRVSPGQHGRAVGVRPAGTNGPVGRRGATARGRRTHVVTCRGEPLAIPRQRTRGSVRVRRVRVRCARAVGTRNAVVWVCTAQYTAQCAPHGRAAVRARVLGLNLPECVCAFLLLTAPVTFVTGIFFFLHTRACLLRT